MIPKPRQIANISVTEETSTDQKIIDLLQVIANKEQSNLDKQNLRLQRGMSMVQCWHCKEYGHVRNMCAKFTADVANGLIPPPPPPPPKRRGQNETTGSYGLSQKANSNLNPQAYAYVPERQNQVAQISQDTSGLGEVSQNQSLIDLSLR